MRTRKIAIGDIHGGALALVQLLERLNYDPANDQLIFVGDYVDGWPESKQLLDILIKLKLENPNNIFLRGNHDDWFLDFINDGAVVAQNHWVHQGGRATLESYGAHVQPNMSDYLIDVEIPQDHKDFIKATELYYIDDQNRGFVHAGYQSFEGLGHDEDFVYMWDRGLAYMLPMRSSDPIPKILRAHDELYIGHTTTLQWKTTDPINLRGKFFNIDTGGGWSGKLTAINIDTKQVWQSDFVKDLYPNEKGR